MPACASSSVNVKNWRDGQMALRWCAAGMNEAARQFCKVSGFMRLMELRTWLERHAAAGRDGRGEWDRPVCRVSRPGARTDLTGGGLAG